MATSGITIFHWNNRELNDGEGISATVNAAARMRLIYRAAAIAPQIEEL